MREGAGRGRKEQEEAGRGRKKKKKAAPAWRGIVLVVIFRHIDTL